MATTPTPEPGAWARWRLLATLAGVALTALTLLIGLGLAVWTTIVTTPPPPTTAESASVAGERGDAYRDQVAAQSMLQVPAAAASTPDVSTSLAPTLEVAVPDSVGPAGVPTGFPRTSEGAVAQLAAIEVTVVEAMSIPVAHQVHDAWSLPGGSSAAEWTMTRNVQVFLNTLGDQGNAKDDSVLVTATPAAGQVKGTDGPDWVLACVLLDVRAAVATTARIGYGHCERMSWHDGRWQIGPGTPPAKAPSTWPGSDLAVQAGWRTWQTG